MGNTKNLEKAIKAWKSVLSKRCIIQDDAILKSEGTATFATKQKILAILKPKSTKEVAAVMKVASATKVPVYPISSGKNWGLGSRVPQRDGVLLDLSLMKKISNLDQTMAHMRVEPGVTFGEAVDYLQEHAPGLMLDTIGSTPDASIIGNTAERGHGMALYADRFNFVCGFEVVLPNGEIIRTGFEDMEGSKLGPLAKWGVGPYVDGLFTQSNFGVITSLTVWLRPKTDHFLSFIFHTDSAPALSKVMEEWRAMGLQGLNASLRIFNDVRMISFAQRFPEDEQRPLSDHARAALRRKMRIGKWIGLGAVYPVSALHAAADKRFIEERIGALVDSMEFFDQQSVDTKMKTATEQERGFLDFMFNKTLLRGNVSRAGMNMVYWRKPQDINVGDLHQDRCGVLWYCPAIPFTGKDVGKAIEICDRICKKYGFELNIGFLFISQRALDITGALCYDRDVRGEDQRAMACHNELMDSLNNEGYSPYRLGIQSMNMMKHKSKSGQKFYAALKNVIDPYNVLAPGHYENVKKK